MSETTIRVTTPPITSTVDGPGERRVVYLQGCPIHCAGCQAKERWDPEGGIRYFVEDLALLLVDEFDGMPVTISGGEPFLQVEAVAELLYTLRAYVPDLHIIVYTGYVIEDLMEMAQVIPAIVGVLNTADVLIDGPYLAQLDHDKMQWRGSSNQRPINLRESVWYGLEIVHLELEDWETQTLTIDLDGDITGTAGTMSELFDDTQPTRMCGQSDKAQEHEAWMRGIVDAILDRNDNPYTASAGLEALAWQRGHDIDPV